MELTARSESPQDALTGRRGGVRHERACFRGGVDAPHSLSLGMRLSRRIVCWAFDKSEFDVDNRVIADLIERGLVSEATCGVTRPERWARELTLSYIVPRNG